MTAVAAAAPVSPPLPACALRFWLLCVILLTIAMVTLGGATRLTGSGLSITEWAPVTGAIPPLSLHDWELEFAKYRATPQYALLNAGMSLADFRFIYLWEWSHRLLGRLIGVVYLLPLLAFAAAGRVRGRFFWMMLGIGALGGLQGGIGWIMVASGLKPGMIAVAPIKLMLHLIAACLVLAALVAVATALRARAQPAVSRGVRVFAWVLVTAAFVQIALGALVAGLHAGLTYNTWPLMDGRWVPEILWPLSPWWHNFVETVATVQFNHRIGAYALLALAIAHAMQVARNFPDHPAARRAAWLAAAVGMQAVGGIVTLLTQVPIWAGLIHQLGAVLVLAFAVLHLQRFYPPIAAGRPVPA